MRNLPHGFDVYLVNPKSISKILIHQEQEILIHQIKNEFGILIHGLKLAILQKALFFRRLVERVPINFFSMLPNSKSDHLS